MRVLRPSYRLITALPLLCGMVPVTLAGADTVSFEFFEKNIRPVLVSRCSPCHSSALPEPKGGLRLDSKAGVLRGGQSGPAIVPGDPDASRLLTAIRYRDPHLQMPPTGKLSDDVIQNFETWVRDGAPDPRTKEAAPVPAPKGIDFERARRHWAFQPLKDTRPPQVRDTSWVSSPIDAFLLARLEARNIAPAPPADRRTLIRRLTYDLTGLPPTPDEVEAFQADSSPQAFETLVDRLLASPHYGERWARHWLDLVRFAETDGHEFDVDKPNVWRYRDYVVRAFNDDIPYNRFLREQLAGDLLPQDRIRDGVEQPAIGSGFLWLGEIINTPVDEYKALADRVDNQIDVFGKTFIGLTTACARCHDHKFDPIPTSDYYALAGFFHSSRLRQAVVDPPEQTRSTRGLVAQIDEIDQQIARKTTPRPAPPSIPEPQGCESIAGFRQPGYGAWLSTGLAFGDGPWDQTAFSGLASNKLQGILISPEFRNSKRYLHVRSARQGTGDVFVRLYVDDYTNGGRKVEPESELKWKTLDTQMGQGHRAYIAIEDFSRDGAILVDQICFSDSKQPPSTETQTLAPWPGQDSAISGLLAKRRALEEQIPESRFALATTDNQPIDIRINVRGNPANPGDPAPRRFLQLFSGSNQPPIPSGSGRLELVDRMLADAQPLIARVMVNRIWQHHFGTGLVGTSDNFGMTGDRPVNPELLDFLATEFIRSGWSVKRMHRLLLTSSAYRMASTPDAKADAADPGNTLLHRMPIRRLEAESIRDGMLAVAGVLDRTLYGPSVTPFVSPFMDGDPRGKPKSGPLDGNNRRSLYINVRRNYLSDMFLTFDYPQPITTIGRRGQSTVASQALYLMNNEFVAQQAARWADRLLRQEQEDRARLRRMYWEAFARPPAPAEVREGLAAIAHWGGGEGAWTDFAHVLLNTTEFLYIR